MVQPEKLVKLYKETKLDIRKGTDDYRKRILQLPQEVASDYDVKVLVDQLDKAALQVNTEGKFEDLQNVFEGLRQRFAYTIGLTEKDRKAKKEDIKDTIVRGLEYIAATQNREESQKGIIKLEDKANELERKIAA